MILGIREYALIGVVVGVGLLGWRWWHLEGVVSTQGKALEAHQQALRTANLRLASLDAALADKADKDAQERRGVAVRERKLEELTREDPTVAAWADQRIPDRVRDLDASARGEAAPDGADGSVRD